MPNEFVARNGIVALSDSRITGSLTAPNITGSLFGTASWARNSISSSYPVVGIGTTLYSTNGTPPSNFGTCFNIILGQSAGLNSSNSAYSNFIGPFAGCGATRVSVSNFIGSGAGQGAINVTASNFIGQGAGVEATNACCSTFLGYLAGQCAVSASNSNFFGSNAGLNARFASCATMAGLNAGYGARHASHSIFLGTFSGYYATSASYSTFLGFRAGCNTVLGPNYVDFNNIIIGTNITLPSRARSAINIGGLIFGTGSYGDLSTTPFSGSVGNGRIGINQAFPSFSLDVSGSGRFTGDLTVTSSLVAPNITGSLFGTASWAVSASWAPGGSGTSGTSGTSGITGTNGTSGTSGTTGTSGTSGTTGAAGTSGTSGTSGTTGAAGTSGTTGTSGTSGTSGTTGTSGTSGVTGASGVTSFSKSLTIFNNAGIQQADTGSFIIYRTQFAATASLVMGLRDSGSGLVINAYKNAEGTTLLSSNLSVNVTGSFVSSSADQNRTFNVGDVLGVRIVNFTGSIKEITVQVDFTQ